MVIEQYWAWFNQSIGEEVHGETYRIAGIELEEWKKKGHHMGFHRIWPKKGGTMFYFCFFEDAFVLTKEKRGGKVKHYFVEGP
jgi:hypothetical protein